MDIESLLVSGLRRNGLDDEWAPVVVQCFEFGALQRLREGYGVLARLVLLTSGDGAPYDLRSSGSPCSYADLTPPAGLDLVSTFADGIGPEKTGDQRTPTE